MHVCGPLSQAMSEATLNDLFHFFVDRGLGPQLLRGAIRYIDAAHLVLFLAGEPEGGEALSAKALRSKVMQAADKIAETYDTSEELDLRVVANGFDTRLLPGVLKEFSNTSVTWALIEDLMRDIQRQAAPRKAASGAPLVFAAERACCIATEESAEEMPGAHEFGARCFGRRHFLFGGRPRRLGVGGRPQCRHGSAL